MKKLVVKVEVQDDKQKSKAMRVVSGFVGTGSVTMDMKDRKLTASGYFDPVEVVKKLRKKWCTELVTFETAKEDDGKEVKDKNDKVEKVEKENQVAKPVNASQAYCPPQLIYYMPPECPPECPLNCVKC